jgi:hypothetical protein
MQTSLMVDLREPGNVVVQLEQALRWFGPPPPVPVGHVFGYSVPVDDERPLPPEVIALIDELVDALADSGPFDSRLSTHSWLSVQGAARAASRIRDDRPAVASRAARQALRSFHYFFTSAAWSARRDERSMRMRIESSVSAVLGDPKRVAAELVPDERLLFACRARLGLVVIATDRRLLVSEQGHGTTRPRAVWSSAYAAIDSLETRWPFNSNRTVTLRTGDVDIERTGDAEITVTLSGWTDREHADVLSLIWKLRRAATEEGRTRLR